MKKVQLGCGDVYLDGFINTDLGSVPGAHTPLDVRDPLPYEDESVDIIVASHLLELLSYREVAHLMQEIYRVLKHGGYARFHFGDPLLPAHWIGYSLENLVDGEDDMEFLPADKETTFTGDPEVLKAKGTHGPAVVFELKKL